MNYYGVVWSFRDSLTHYGIKGQRWGIRRFQYENGSYTPEGKERYYKDYDRGVKKGKYDNDPELRDLYVMEQKEIDHTVERAQKTFMDSLTSNSKALSRKDRKLIEKVRSGQILSSSEERDLNDAWRKYGQHNFKLQRQHDSILKKYNAWSSNDSLSPDAKKKNDAIADEMSEYRQAVNEMNYASMLYEEQQYARSIRDDINSAKNQKYVDPAYRTFSSKDEKAKAEAEYMRSTWELDYADVTDENEDRLTNEAVHIMHKMTGLSMNGNDAIPKSERNKAMYDHKPRSDYDRFVPFDDYDNWIPKYEKTDEWKDLQDRREKLRIDSEYSRLDDEYHKAVKSNSLSKKELAKLFEARDKAYEEYNNELHKIEKEERRIEEPFYTQIAKNVLLDLGYEVTPENIECIFPIVWYD